MPNQPAAPPPPPASDPLVLDARLEDDRIDLVLTREGYDALVEMRDLLREDDPSADFQDVLREAFAALREELESMN